MATSATAPTAASQRLHLGGTPPDRAIGGDGGDGSDGGKGGDAGTGLDVKGLDPTLVCSKIATGCVHGPPAPPICGTPPQWSQFAVSAKGLIPNKWYSLRLGGTAHGVTEKKSIGSILADKSGTVTNQVFTLPAIPAHDAWTLTAKPRGGGPAPTAMLETGEIDCIAISAGGGSFRSQIAAVGLTPKSPFTETIDGVTAKTIQADANGSVPATEADGSCRSGLVHITAFRLLA